jgi:hypothetical protein
MNIISNTLISIESDPDIHLTLSITSILDEKKFTIKIGDVEHDLSAETVEELKLALRELQDISDYAN